MKFKQYFIDYTNVQQTKNIEKLRKSEMTCVK